MTSDKTTAAILRENASRRRRDDAVLVERKRNEIQIWERTYEHAHNRKPTRKDVEENESVRKMYREYKELMVSMTSTCTKSIQNKNNNNNGKGGGDFENFHPTAKKEEYESDGEDEVIEATPPRKQRHIKQQQHNKSSFSKSSSMPSSMSSPPSSSLALSLSCCLFVHLFVC